MLSVRLPKEIEDRLSALSRRTHRFKTYYIKEALERYLGDEEDYAILVAAYEDHLRKDGKTWSLDELKAELNPD